LEILNSRKLDECNKIADLKRDIKANSREKISMPYSSEKDLPSKVRGSLPRHAQHIYREVFNNAIKQYQSPSKKRNKTEPGEKVAHKVAWAAVKKKYKKVERGEWTTK
jgi:cation transport regulator